MKPMTQKILLSLFIGARSLINQHKLISQQTIHENVPNTHTHRMRSSASEFGTNFSPLNIFLVVAEIFFLPSSYRQMLACAGTATTVTSLSYSLQCSTSVLVLRDTFIQITSMISNSKHVLNIFPPSFVSENYKNNVERRY